MSLKVNNESILFGAGFGILLYVLLSKHLVPFLDNVSKKNVVYAPAKTYASYIPKECGDEPF